MSDDLFAGVGDAHDAPPGGNASGSPESRFANHPAHHSLTPQKWREQENKRLKLALGIETALLVLLGLMFFLALPAMVMGEIAGPVGTLSTEVVRSGDAGHTVAIVPVSGVIYAASGGPGGHSGSADWILKALEEASTNESVKAVILEVDSPGGTMTGSDLVHREVKRFRDEGGNVVAFFGNVAASGGYYVSAAANKIIAQPTTITGSIGVIMQTYRIDRLLEKIGVEAVTVKTGKFKDIGSPFRPIEDEERDMLQAMAEEAHSRFVSVIENGRGLTTEQVASLADGRLFTSAQAKGAGLIDEIGYLDDAIALAEQVAGIEKARVIRYRHPPSLLDLFSAQKSAPDPAAELARFLTGLGPAYLMDRQIMADYLATPPSR
jgi:protease-4